MRQDVSADLWTMRMQGDRSLCQPGHPSTLSQSSVLLRSLPDGIYPAFLRVCVHTCTQSCLILCDLMDCNPPCSFVYGIFLLPVLEWVAISSSRGSSEPGIEPKSPALQVNSLLLSDWGSDYVSPNLPIHLVPNPLSPLGVCKIVLHGCVSISVLQI